MIKKDIFYDVIHFVRTILSDEEIFPVSKNPVINTFGWNYN